MITGSACVAAVSRDTGDVLFGSPRHEAFSASDTHVLNQQWTSDGPWGVVDRSTGMAQFIDSTGVPRLFGPVLVQFGPDTITMTHLKHRTTVEIPHSGELTTFDLVLADDEEYQGYMATGDLFGTVRVDLVDFQQGHRQELRLWDTTPAVYGTEFVFSRRNPLDAPVLLVLRGAEPQYLEFYRLEAGSGVADDSLLLRHTVPGESVLRSAPAVSPVTPAMYAVSTSDALVVVDLERLTTLTLMPTPHRPVIGFLTGRTRGFAFVSVDDEALTINLGDVLRENGSVISWHVAGARAAALEKDLVVLELDNRFFAVEIAR